MLEERVDKKEPTQRDKEIGRRIVQARLENGGMQQKDLAELLEVTPRMMQDYESGRVVPWSRMELISEHTGRPAGWLIHGEAWEPSPAGNELFTLLEEIQAKQKEHDAMLLEILRQLQQG